MSELESFTVGPPSWLTLIGTDQVQAPASLMSEVGELSLELEHALQGNYEDLEAVLEGLLPKVWDLRIKALPILAQLDFSEAMKMAESDFSLIPKKNPSLGPVVEKLVFGFQLMKEFVENLLAQKPKFTKELSKQALGENPPSFSEMMEQLAVGGFVEANFIHGSLMIDLLLFAVDLSVEKELPLDPSICYELDYQSAVAVKEYASAFGIDKTKVPWYTPPKNNLGKLLAEGPVVSEEDLQYVYEKRAHFNTWK